MATLRQCAPLVAIEGADIADEIGRLYYHGIQNWLEAGRLLRIQKDALDHGQWLPWLKENEQKLGFGVRAAQRLIEASKQVESNTQLDCASLWWNEKRGAKGRSGDNEWYTAPEIVDLVRKVLGEIDLDPASCEFAQAFVKAKQFFTKADDGLKQQWRGRVFLNPPYSQPGIAEFIAKLLTEWQAGRVTAAIVLTHAYTDVTWFHRLLREGGAICFTHGRLDFVDPSGNMGKGAHGQAFTYFGSDRTKFIDVFTEAGFVLDLTAAAAPLSPASNVVPVNPALAAAVETGIKNVWLAQEQKRHKRYRTNRALKWRRDHP